MYVNVNICVYGSKCCYITVYVDYVYMLVSLYISLGRQ